ncbi:DUF2878 domain-containing protein [Dyella sp. C11]|uniref:DUF2878 domain-containing protein n=1 Tax=Dyella sp. C11 TaxID=2126991 RepID=UPI000D64C084|nr:DUF2878 domain-containing protein [Dyella sp. C11]
MFWINLIGYQIVWFALVIGASRGHVGWAMGAGAVFVVSQVLTAQNLSVECRLLVLAVVLGVVVDGMCSLMGWLRYASPAPALPPHGAPMWILMLWACFSTTIHRSLAWLRHRRWLAALVGAIGAPLAYAAAARGWHTVEFTQPSYVAIVWLAASWAGALALLVACAKRWSVQAARSST